MNDSEIRIQLLKDLVEAQKVLEEKLETQDQMIKRFQALTANEGLFVQIIDYFPYPIAVFSSNGMLEVVNNALLAEVGVSDRKMLVNRLNIFSYSSDIAAGISDAIKRVLAGETIFLFDLKDTLKTLGESYGITGRGLPACQDAIFFPITDNDGKVCNAVAVLINQQG